MNTNHDIRHSFQELLDDGLVADLAQQPGAVPLPHHALQTRHVAVVAPYPYVVSLDHQETFKQYMIEEQALGPI